MEIFYCLHAFCYNDQNENQIQMPHTYKEIKKRKELFNMFIFDFQLFFYREFFNRNAPCFDQVKSWRTLRYGWDYGNFSSSGMSERYISSITSEEDIARSRLGLALAALYLIDSH